MLHKKHFDDWDGEIVNMHSLREHTESFSGTAPDHKGHHVYPHIYPIVTGYAKGNGQSCPALAPDGTCNLHDDKPAMCRSVPFDPALPEHLQAIVLRRFARAHECMKPTAQPDGTDVIFRDGRITDPSAKADYERRLAAMRKERDVFKILSSFIPKSNGTLSPTAEQFTRTVEKKGWIETAMSSLLFVLLNDKQITPAIAESYLRAQVALIEPQIAAALERRRSADRERTATMRLYLAEYARILETGVAEHFLV